MEAININIPEIKVENDFSIIYKGKEEDDDNNIIEIKTSKDEVVRTLRYFKQRINEVQHLNEYYIHDKFSCKIFKEFIESIKTKALTLTEYNYQEYYELSKKYEYYELQQEIEKFAKQRPDLKAVINQLSTKSNFIEENEEVDIISDPIKEEIISKHLDICLRNPNLIKLPIQMLNRILNSPNRVLNDYHLLFDFIMKVVQLRFKNKNEIMLNDQEDLEVLINSLDYQEMSNKEIEEFLLLDESLTKLYHPAHAENKIKQLISENIEKEQTIHKLESTIEDLYTKYNELNDFISINKTENDQEMQKNNSKFDKQAKINEKIQNKMNKHKKKIEEQSNTILKFQTEFQNQKKELNDCKAYIQNLEKIIKSQQIKIDQQEKSLQDSSQKLLETRNMCEKLFQYQNKIEKESFHDESSILNIQKQSDSLKSTKSSNDKDEIVFTQEYHNDSFSGILANLTRKHKCNINDKKIIKITGNGYLNDNSGSFSSLVDYNYDGPSYESENELNSYLCIDFVDHAISISAYSIKSSNNFPPSYLRSWVLEGSNDKVNWIELDSHTKDFILCSKSEVRTFTVQDKSKCEQHFRYVQLRMTGRSSNEDFVLEIMNIEFFGKYFR